ncbi:MAG: transketolase [bacterium P3]|nr:MAG: transketolase [bacterium P201]KWW30452.1 MAG: transketolase [bacterium P3]KWW41339.1 MAG: transketolase [bacterium F083]
MKNIQELQQIATQVRRDILRMTTAAQSGHPGGSLGTADWFVAMYFDLMDIEPSRFTMEGTDEDMLFVSQGHITPVIYSTMARRGYFPVSELASFRKFGTRLQGHPSTAHGLPGIRMASGSLGQGMSVGIGAAIGKKMTGDRRLVYTMHGDGELQEGQIWEAAMFAGAKKVDNLISTVDYNRQQIDATVDEVMSLGDLRAKFESFMWNVVVIDNGNDMAQVFDGMSRAKSLTGQGAPVCVILGTKMGFGVDFMQDTNKYHGSVLSADDLPKALAQLPETLGDF